MFAQLDIKSAYSLLDGTMDIETIVKTSKQLGYRALAITDFNVLFNVMEFYHLAKKHNIKPIFGLRLLINHEEDAITYLLLAKNNQGYQDLLKLSSKTSSQEINYEEMLPYLDHCIVIVYGEGGIIEHEKIATESYLEQYSQDLVDFYIGISNNSSTKWKQDNKQLKALCQQMNIETVALPKVEFLNPDFAEVKKLFSALKHNRKFNDYSNVVNEKNYFLTLEELKEYYNQEDLAKTMEIANACNVDLTLLPKAKLPRFPQDTGASSEEFLRALCQVGLEKRLNNEVSSRYQRRLNHELQVINNMGFADYFLIVYDFILFAKKEGIYVGPGRGSSAGSLVAYVLGITEIDPLQYDLLFERFLNPERVSLPDIDIDFPDNRREEVIDYVKEKYGSDHVAHIITFDTFGARQALRDVGRVMDIPTYQIDSLSKLILNKPKASLQESYDKNVNLRVKLHEEKQLQQVFSLAQKIEGLPRHTSIHAAGIVLADQPLASYCPLIETSEETLTQFTMDYLEELGLNKMDFLGLRNLTIITEVVEQVDDLDIKEIPLDDKKTFELLQRADTSGVFQLESAGMRNLLKKMKPYQFEDIVAAIALYRPGPMANIPSFLKRRFKQEKITYIHEDLKPILESTYGIIVYQEQIMQIAQLMANFSLAKADLLRKAMSDKNPEILASLKLEFIESSIKNNYSRKEASAVYELIEKFADYGFNKAHSVAYSMIAYQMAYLKANYPLEFYLALLNGVKGSQRKTNQYINECKNKNISIVKPSVNKSLLDYRIEQHAIVVPFLAINGVGIKSAQAIIKERERDGVFTSFANFVARANLVNISKDTIENLIYSGALDEFGLNRTSMIENLDNALVYANVMKVNVEEPYLDYDIISEEPKIKRYADDKLSLLEEEYRVLGVYLSSHPIEEKKEQYRYQGDTILKVKETKQTNRLLVQVVSIKEHTTKYGDLMAFIEVLDETDTIDLVVMPDIYKRRKKQIKERSYLLVQGSSDRENSLLVRRLEVID